MNNLSEFLIKLSENGNARLLVHQHDFIYNQYAIMYNDLGELIANTSEVVYDREAIVDGKLNKDAKIVYVMSYDDPSDKCIIDILAKLIASNYQAAKTLIHSDEIEMEYKDYSLSIFYKIAMEMLKISNHELVCSYSAGNHEYLEDYFKRILNLRVLDKEQYDLVDVTNMEEFLGVRISKIKEIDGYLKNAPSEEYLPNAYKWIGLYEDRKMAVRK